MSSDHVLTWLHLSDLHCFAPSNWDAGKVQRTLTADLRNLREKYGLVPQVLFFTGDAAWGQVGTDNGRDLKSQFDRARDFFDECFLAIRPDSDKLKNRRDIYVVPGNHDIDRNRATRPLNAWLSDKSRTLDEINELMQTGGGEWQQYAERLSKYRDFVQTTYEHLLETNPERLFFFDARELSGVRVGISGLNSAWSSTGAGVSENGQLWVASAFQSGEIDSRRRQEQLKLRIALIHHPGGWYRPEEGASAWSSLQLEYDFVLHGHEHRDWVNVDGLNGHVTVSAGAAYERSDKPNGYNIVRLDLDKGEGEIWLRCFDPKGVGWVQRIIHGRTDDHGVIRITGLPKFTEPQACISGSKSNDDVTVSPIATDPTQAYEHDYGMRVANKLDWLELFGVDVPRGSQQYSLSVAYVSLSLAEEDRDDEEEENSVAEETTEPVSMQAEELFDTLLPKKKRLLIQGAAGSGKTTLLRWITIQAARRMESAVAQHGEFVPGFVGSAELPVKGRPSIVQSSEKDSDVEDWREKVPFLIRLRDFPDGRLPRPQDFPRVVIKELRDAPEGWVDRLLETGRTLVLFDGVDEVPEQHRRRVEQEIRDLISAYSEAGNYFAITTRPNAVDENWAAELGFERVRVQPLTPADRDDFIDRWHDAVERQLAIINEPEDLRPLASKLKQVLRREPRIARMANWPLLCAVICALHRQQRENLPRTQVELCEKLCQMLLERRDKERPGLESKSLVHSDYSALPYAVRKGIVAQLAYGMIKDGKSSLAEAQVDAMVGQALTTYPDHANRNAATVREALIVRSGILVNEGGQIEFLHNTLKEYLAAEVFVNANEVDMLLKHSSDEAWQPVLLFAVALPRTNSPVPSQIVDGLLRQIPRAQPMKGKKGKKARAALANLRARQLLVLRCRAQVDQLDPGLTQSADYIAAEIFPPRSLTEGEALAACGPSVLPHLRFNSKMTGPQQAASVRALRLIGGEESEELIRHYASSTYSAAWCELIQVLQPSEIPALVRSVNRYGSLPSSLESTISRNPAHLPKLAGLAALKVLHLSGASVSDISPLAGLKQLSTLQLQNSSVSDISPLIGLTDIRMLGLSHTPVVDISPLAGLTAMEWLYLMRTRVGELGPLAKLTSLKYLDLDGTPITDLSQLSGLNSLESLDLRRTNVSDLSPLSGLTALTFLHLAHTKVSNLAPLVGLASLSRLHLASTQINDISSLVKLASLRSLDLSRTQVADVAPLSALTALNELNLANTQINDISPFSSLTDLKVLDLANTQVNDVSPLAALTALESLDITNSQVIDISPLAGLTNLKIVKHDKPAESPLQATSNHSMA